MGIKKQNSNSPVNEYCFMKTIIAKFERALVFFFFFFVVTACNEEDIRLRKKRSDHVDLTPVQPFVSDIKHRSGHAIGGHVFFYFGKEARESFHLRSDSIAIANGWRVVSPGYLYLKEIVQESDTTKQDNELLLIRISRHQDYSRLWFIPDSKIFDVTLE